MITRDLNVALIMPTQAEVQTCMQALGENGFRRVTAFTSTREAYEVCSRQLFPVFVTRMEMPGMSGIVLIQKLRQSGNYGLEPHLFLCTSVDVQLLNVLVENEIQYVMVAPHTRALVMAKFKHMLSLENALTEGEQKYRDAKTAFLGSRIDMAQEILQPLLNAPPVGEKVLLLHGDILLARKDFDGARQYYVRATEANPKSATAAHKLAQLHMAQGNFKEASDLLNRLTVLNPHNIRLLENAGLSSFSVQRFDEAKDHMAKLFLVDETNKTAASVTAQVKISTGDLNGLVDVLRRGFDENELIQFLNNAGAKLSQSNDIDGALKMYSAALEQITASRFLYAIHYNMGIAYRRKNEPSRARSHLLRALELKPDFDKAKALLDSIESAA